MAKHLVKCFYCGETFDANQYPFVMVNSRRYAHKDCQDKKIANESKLEKDKRVLDTYIKELFGYKTIPIKVEKQIQNLTHDLHHNYTYSGIYKTLKYFFEIRNNPIEKANGGIGIVPYVYDEAYRYWYAIWEAQQKNEIIDIKQYVLPAKEIHIIPPKREPMRHTRKLFSFLNEEGDS